MKRADEDFGWAQYALGMRYLTGNGVPQDDAQGRKWLEKSAKNGESRAVKELAKLEKEKGEPGESVGSTESHKDKGDAKPEEKSAPTSKSGDAGKK